MGANAAENTNLRLKAVLDVLAEGVWSGEKLNAGVVLGEAIARVPLNDHERELLSGGIPRGHKALTTATAKLVKAGWLVKGRSGWTITEDGQRATVAFADPAAFTAALDAGTQPPADTPLPAAPAGHSGKSAAKAAPRAVKVAEEVAEKVADTAAKLVEEVVAPVAKAVRKRKASEKGAAAAEPAAPAASVEPIQQPAEVAVAGDFNVLLGAPANWAPQYDESQMQLDEVDQLWKLAAELPAGSYSFKIAINRSWDENYGAFGHFDGANHEVHHRGGLMVIQYDHRTKDIVIG